jgi:hypothetical protein
MPSSPDSRSPIFSKSFADCYSRDVDGERRPDDYESAMTAARSAASFAYGAPAVRRNRNDFNAHSDKAHQIVSLIGNANLPLSE